MSSFRSMTRHAPHEVRPPVGITGVGAATPLGNSYAKIAERLLAGKSGIGRVTRFDVSDHACQIAGQVDFIPCPVDFDQDEFHRLCPLEQVALWCCSEALDDAGWKTQREERRIALVLGAGAEWIFRWEWDWHRGGTQVLQKSDDTRTTAHLTAKRLEISGPGLTVAAACASGNCALDLGRRLIQMGLADVCLAGACDMGVTPLSMAAFGNLRVLSKCQADPQSALRPFDRSRDGMVLGEGGAMFVLETLESARRRGARVYAEVAGVGATNDAHHLVSPCPDPAQAIAAFESAMNDAGVTVAEIDYINAHATGTPVGDACEARALRAVLGNRSSQVPVSSTKSMTGHLLSAAAAVEAVACLAALENQAIPPTINLTEPDPACDLAHVANVAQPAAVRVAVSNSLGFGGNNTCLILRAAD